MKTTRVKLLDGREHEFAALPATMDNAPLVAIVLGEDVSATEYLRALHEALTRSLRLTTAEKDIPGILALIPNKGEVTRAVVDAVFRAWIDGDDAEVAAAAGGGVPVLGDGAG